MNDLEMYREQLALCDDKIIDALVERNAIVEKIMAYKEEYGMPILQPQKRYTMFSAGSTATASASRQGSCLTTISSLSDLWEPARRPSPIT